MDVEDAQMGEVLNQLRLISTSVISSEYLKEDITELKTDFKMMHGNFSTMETSLNEFKTEMAPIIDFKKQVQSQIIKFSALAFTTLLALNFGMGQV